MKTAPAGLITFFNTARQALQFDLWTFGLANGSVLRWTDADVDITIDTRTFTRGPVITRDRVKWVRGIEVDQLKAVLAGPSVQIGGVALPAFAAAGGFDGAVAILERVYLNDAGVVQGALSWFSGQVADVYPGRMGCELVIKSQLTQLSQQLPRNLYQAGCLNDLYDSNCAVARASFTTTGTVNAASTDFNPLLDVTVGVDQRLGFFGAMFDLPFSLGVCKFSTGANAGISRTVQAYTRTSSLHGQMRFSRPFPFRPAAGDAFSLSCGCDKTQATCQDKFNNLARFRGQPYIPVPETVT